MAKKKPAAKKLKARKQKRGRPLDSGVFKPEFAEMARKYVHKGATDIEVADLFGVSVRTIYRWKHSHPNFCHALRVGSVEANERVKSGLYHKAIGYSFEAVKIMQHNGVPVIVPYTEHVPPDPVAAKFWLINRDPENWREKMDMNHSGEVSIAEAIKAGRERARAGKAEA